MAQGVCKAVWQKLKRESDLGTSACRFISAKQLFRHQEDEKVSETHNIRPSTNSLVERMFIATADENYILARWAAINHLDLDFLWLGLHAVEKYLKAVLLLNGKPAKGYNHNIERLYQDVLRLNPRLSFESLAKPPFLQGMEHTHWIDESVEGFVRRLNDMGDPNNRYMLYGFDVWSEDLFKLDQVVWKIRRHCRPLKQFIRDARQTITIDWIEQLKKHVGHWTLGSNLPIEKVLAGNESPAITEAFRALNVPFTPDRIHVLAGWRTSSRNSPLADWYRQLRNEQAPPERRDENKSKFQWVLDNIDLPKRDKEEIQAALDTYRGGAG
jgi:hypothetical protein